MTAKREAEIEYISALERYHAATKRVEALSKEFQDRMNAANMDVFCESTSVQNAKENLKYWTDIENEVTNG